MTKNTMNAIRTHLNNAEDRFHIGRYYYECDINGIIRRREQAAGCLPTSGWELVAHWDPMTLEITEVQ